MLTDKPVISRNLHKGFYNLVEFKQKADHISAKVLLADFGDQIHIAKVNDRYVLMIEADTLTFEKGFSPIEFLKPDELQDVIERIENKQQYSYDPNGLNKFFHLTVLLGAFNKRSFIWGIVFIYIKTDSTKNRFFCFITKYVYF